MSTYKTKVESGDLASFARKYNIAVTDLDPIADGEVSQAYFFRSEGQDKVLRINTHTDEGFKKDKFAYEHFRGRNVHIPKIEEIGQLPGGLFYAVSEKLSGKTLDKLTEKQFQTALPAVIQTMEAIHQTEPVGPGFGWIKLDGNGKYDSWHAALDGSQAGEEDDDLDSIKFFERNIYDNARVKIKEYYKFCPKHIRKLVHTDYGFGNTLIDNGRVIGVLDWDGVAYGDPLYDVAWLVFWTGAFSWKINVATILEQYYTDQNRQPQDFEERIVCYQMIIAANCMSFFAKSNQEDKYIYVRDQLLKTGVLG